jgi:hypothetical protein
MSISATEDADLEFAPAVTGAAIDATRGGGVSTPNSVNVVSVPREQRRKFIDLLWLVSMLGVVSAKSIRPAIGMDEDLWSHIATGNWILAHRAVPTQDVFGAYTTGKPWLAYTWLFDVFMAKIYSAAGLHGIATLATLLTLGFVAALVVLFSRCGRMLRAIALAALVFSASAVVVAPRPWLFTCLFFVVELYLLSQARDRGQPAWLIPVVPLLALWANVHIQFVYGLAVIGLFAMEYPLAAVLKWDPTPAKRLTWWFWATLVVSTVATLANPYGWRLYTVVAEYATQKAALQVIQEMQPLQFRTASDWAALFLVCSAIFAIAGRQRRSALMISLLIVSMWFGFRTGRDVWFMAVISAWVVANYSGQADKALTKVRTVQWAIAVPVTAALAFAVLQSKGLSAKALQDAASQRFPVQASAYIENHGMKNPLYNPYGWGGYLIWRLPGMPVSIDGRANLYGDGGLVRFIETWTGQRNWAEDPALTKANTIILERNSALASILRSDARFRMVYDDEVASVFEPIRTGWAKQQKKGNQK